MRLLSRYFPKSPREKLAENKRDRMWGREEYFSPRVLSYRTKARVRLNRDRKISLTEFSKDPAELDERVQRVAAISLLLLASSPFARLRRSIRSAFRSRQRETTRLSLPEARLVSAVGCAVRARHENQYPFPFETSRRPYRGVFRSTVSPHGSLVRFRGTFEGQTAVAEGRFLPIALISGSYSRICGRIEESSDVSIAERNVH